MWPVIARGSPRFICHPLTNHTCLPQHHRRLAGALWLVGGLLIAPTHGGMARLSCGWLVMYWDRFFHIGSWTPDTVTHPSRPTNRARRRLTLSKVSFLLLPFCQPVGGVMRLKQHFSNIIYLWPGQSLSSGSSCMHLCVLWHYQSISFVAVLHFGCLSRDSSRLLMV